MPLKIEWWTYQNEPLRCDAVDLQRMMLLPFPILLPVSCRVIQCLVIVFILHWIQNIAQRGNLFYEGKLSGRNIIWLIWPVPEFLRVRDLPLQLINTISSTVTAVCYSPFVEIYCFGRSFCQQSPHSFTNTVLQVIVYTAIFYNFKTKFLLIMFIKFDLDSNCIFFGSFLMFSNVIHLIAFIPSLCDVTVHLNCL